jgi:hypothetical protein
MYMRGLEAGQAAALRTRNKFTLSTNIEFIFKYFFSSWIMSGAASGASARSVQYTTVARLQSYGIEKNKTPAEILKHLHKKKDAQLVGGYDLNP